MADQYRSVATPLSGLDIPAEEKCVRHVVGMVERTQRERDAAGFMSLLSPEAIWVTALGRTLRGWEEINAFTHRVLTPSLGDKYASYEVTDIKFLSHEVVAVNVRQKPIDAAGNRDPEEREGRPLYVMVKHSGDWLISVAQNTQVTVGSIDHQQ